MSIKSGIALVAVAFLVLVLAAAANGQSGIVVGGADTVRTESAAAYSGPTTMAARIITQFANNVRQFSLTKVPGAFESALVAVGPRVVVEFSNSIRAVPLTYPMAAIGDTTAPVVTNVQVVRGSSSAVIRWTTNEFATSEVRYGTQPGNYPQIVSKPLFVREHEITLTGLAPGTTYYYRILSTDLSGNPVQSGELQLTPQRYVYLPMTRR